MVNGQNSCNAEAAQKILNPVSYDGGFHFFMREGHYAGEPALSLCSFLKDMDSIDTESIKFHFDCDDFQKRLRTIVGDKELALIIDKLDNNSRGKSQGKIGDTVQKRISELQLKF